MVSESSLPLTYTAKSLIWLLENKIKTKYNALAQWDSDSYRNGS